MTPDWNWVGTDVKQIGCVLEWQTLWLNGSTVYDGQISAHLTAKGASGLTNQTPGRKLIKLLQMWTSNDVSEDGTALEMTNGQPRTISTKLKLRHCRMDNLD